MWRTDTYWFDIAVATTVLMLGHLYFGRFEEHRPRWRRLLKSVLVVAIVVAITAWAGRAWMFAFLSLGGLAVLAIHGCWLPRKGVNGWTPNRATDTTPSSASIPPASLSIALANER